MRRSDVASKFLNTRRRESLLSTVWGGMWGIVVGGVIVTVASQLAVRHDLVLPKPVARAVETPAGTEFDQARPETDPELPSEETVPAADVAAATPARPGPADASPQFDTTPASAPSTRFDGPASPERPDVPAGADVALTSREALRPETGLAPEASAPLPPGVERNVNVARTTPEPPVEAPRPETAEAAPQTVAPAAPPAAPVVAEADAAAPALEAAPPAVVAEVAPDQPQADPGEAPLAEAASAGAPDVAGLDPAIPAAPVSDDTVTAEVPQTGADTAPDAPAPAAPVAEAPQNAPRVLATPVVPEAPAEDEVEVAVAEAESAPDIRAPDAPSQPAAAADVPQTPRAVRETPTLIQTSEPRRITPDTQSAQALGVGTPAARLGSDDQAAVVAEPADAAPAPKGALMANRAAFEANPDMSKLAVILTHEGEELPGADALSDLPAEVSFAVDARTANAGEIAAAYRAAGREVVLIPSFPPRATPQDIEVALGANLAEVPGAVAVMDPGSAGFQNDRSSVGQVIAVLAESGHGLITMSRGLNPAQQIADRFEVPAALIFNDLGRSADASSAARALDRVAFRARQETGIIVLGSADAVTKDGIKAWLDGRSADGLQLAPVSAVMAPLTDAAADETEAPADTGGLPQVRRLPQIQSQSN
ncbi:MAG: divergent polysaccharide deacetylase family protein [Pseudomonadota bacterium]